MVPRMYVSAYVCLNVCIFLGASIVLVLEVVSTQDTLEMSRNGKVDCYIVVSGDGNGIGLGSRGVRSYHSLLL